MRRPVLCGLVLGSALAAPAAAGERLILLGGGPRSPEALGRLVHWAGADGARLLVVAWASADPDQAYRSLREELALYRPGSVDPAPSALATEADRARFSTQLAAATAVFFTGGDQRRLMDVVEQGRVGDALRRRYAEGVVFAGTSAGTAVMSALAITADRDRRVMDDRSAEVRRGLGILPGVILDQHFVQRQRQNRLFGLVLAHPDLLGVGVDEGTALAVRDNRHAEVLGASKVTVVDAQPRGDLLLHLLQPGDSFDLLERRRP